VALSLAKYSFFCSNFSHLLHHVNAIAMYHHETRDDDGLTLNVKGFVSVTEQREGVEVNGKMSI
jgi:hypothetical protein